MDGVGGLNHELVESVRASHRAAPTRLVVRAPEEEVGIAQGIAA